MKSAAQLAEFMVEAYKERCSEKKGYGKREDRKKGARKRRRKGDKEAEQYDAEGSDTEQEE